MEEIKLAKYLLAEIEEIEAYVAKHPCSNKAGCSAQTIKDNAKMVRRLMNRVTKKYTNVY